LPFGKDVTVKTTVHISHRFSIWPTDDLDGIDKSITLPHPMVFLIRIALLCTAATLIFSESVAASVIFQPGKKAKYVAPGEEQVSDTALELYNTAQSAEKEGNLKKAIRAYSEIVRRHPKDALAPGALYRGAQLQEQLHEYFVAADSYRLLVEKYPGNLAGSGGDDFRKHCPHCAVREIHSARAIQHWPRARETECARDGD
jgi:tetratricopeptide (TPR) repeat protein